MPTLHGIVTNPFAHVLVSAGCCAVLLVWAAATWQIGRGGSGVGGAAGEKVTRADGVSQPRAAKMQTAQNRAREARNGVEIAYAIPKDGTQLWFDNLAIPRDSRHIDEAHALINYLLRPDVAAKNTNFICYANGVATSRALVDKAILDDKSIYPDAATMSTFYTTSVHDPATTRLTNRLWTRIKTGE